MRLQFPNILPTFLVCSFVPTLGQDPLPRAFGPLLSHLVHRTSSLPTLSPHPPASWRPQRYSPSSTRRSVGAWEQEEPLRPLSEPFAVPSDPRQPRMTSERIRTALERELQRRPSPLSLSLLPSSSRACLLPPSPPLSFPGPLSPCLSLSSARSPTVPLLDPVTGRLLLLLETSIAWGERRIRAASAAGSERSVLRAVEEYER